MKLLCDCSEPLHHLSCDYLKMLHKDTEIIFWAAVYDLVSFFVFCATYRWRDCSDNLNQARGPSCFTDKGVLSVWHKASVRKISKNNIVHWILTIGCACDRNTFLFCLSCSPLIAFFGPTIISYLNFSYIKWNLELWLIWTRDVSCSSCNSLTNQCSKSVRVQFLEDDGVGGSVSLEYLGGREREKERFRERKKCSFKNGH